MTEFIEILKLIVKPIIALAAFSACIFILFVPLPEQLGLERIRHEYGYILGALAVFSFFLWVWQFIVQCGMECKAIWNRRQDKRKLLAHLDSLNKQEKNILAIAVQRKEQTVQVYLKSPAVASLAEKGLIIIVKDDSLHSLKPITIPRQVWDQIKSDKSLLSIEVTPL